MARRFTWTFVLILSLTISDAAKILGFFPTPSKSHWILCEALVQGLVANGHELTVVTSSASKPSNNSYKEINVGDLKSNFFNHVASNLFDTIDDSTLLTWYSFARSGYQLTENIFANPQVQHLLKSDEQFDVVISLIMLNEAHFVLSHIFKAPIIGISTLGPTLMSNHFVGNPAWPSYVPQIMFPYTDHMSFTERLQNTLATWIVHLYRQFIYFPQQERLMHKYFPNAPSLQSILKNTSLIFVNSHVSMGYPRPMLPNVIEIGGFHIKKLKTLPEDLQKYLDEAHDGVIYFSMGSNLKSSDLSVTKRDALLQVFSQLKQKILWKWDNDTLPNQPSNVQIRKWLPQQEILAHPNIKIFITHGGLLSTTETVFHGVPIIGIPIYGDQVWNMQQIQTMGYGLRLQYNNLTEESIRWAINEVIYNSSYTENVKERSSIFRDEIVKPIDKAVYWVEYVIRHKGAYHLRSAAQDLNLYEYLLLDVITFIALVVIALFTVTILIIKQLCKLKPSKSKKDTKLD